MKEPTRLGRGLASLLGEVRGDVGHASTSEIPLNRLEPNPFQPRAAIDLAQLAELTASVQANGVLQPLLIRPHPWTVGRYQIIAGERRWRAALAAGLQTIPCLVRPMKDGEAAAAALVENLQRRDLNAMEEADGFRKLIDEFSMTQDELATTVGKSRSHVANTLRLLTLPDSVAQRVRDGILTSGHARAALACADPAAAADQMVAEGLNVRQAEELGHVRPRNPDFRPARTPALPDPDRSAVEADLAERLGLKVEISFNGSGGVVKLRYQTLDQLDHIVARLGRA